MGSKFLIDTNIWIDMLSNLPEAAATLKQIDDAALSAITYMEVASGCTPSEKVIFDLLIEDTVPIIHSDDKITQLATAFNQDPNTWRGRGSKHLPDSIIGATAVASDRILLTRNPGDFKNCTGLTVVAPYQGAWTTIIQNGVEVKIWTSTAEPPVVDPVSTAQPPTIPAPRQ